jgi:hypothetical protein
VLQDGPKAHWPLKHPDIVPVRDVVIVLLIAKLCRGVFENMALIMGVESRNESRQLLMDASKHRPELGHAWIAELAEPIFPHAVRPQMRGCQSCASEGSDGRGLLVGGGI